jgi:hypothetical protein
MASSIGTNEVYASNEKNATTETKETNEPSELPLGSLFRWDVPSLFQGESGSQGFGLPNRLFTRRKPFNSEGSREPMGVALTGDAHEKARTL